MRCEDAAELLGAYALDALPPDEMAAVREHLAGCAKHQVQAAELRAVAARLPALTDPREAPGGLRARVLNAVAREPQQAAARREAPRRVETARSRLSWWPSRGYAWGAMAAVVFGAIAGLLAWNIILQTGDGGSDAQRLASLATSVSAIEASGAPGSGAVIYVASEHKAIVVASGLERLDATQRTYQVWAVSDAGAESLGLMQPEADGHVSMVVPFDAERAGVLAITVEPAGGSPQPTSDPIYSAEI
ncbi:MAG: anti-sigma factor [Dehalococcoidia bacterium]